MSPGRSFGIVVGMTALLLVVALGIAHLQREGALPTSHPSPTVTGVEAPPAAATPTQFMR